MGKYDVPIYNIKNLTTFYTFSIIISLNGGFPNFIRRTNRGDCRFYQSIEPLAGKHLITNPKRERKIR